MILTNLKQILCNIGNSFVHNPNRLKTESLVLASFVLAASRITVSNISAIKAEGTPQEPYRRKESYRTAVREIGGFILSFLVLRQLQRWCQKGLQKLLGMRLAVKPIYYNTMWKDLKGSVTKRGYQVNPFEPNLTVKEKWVYQPTSYSRKLYKLIHQNPLKALLPEKEASMMKRVVRIAPIVIASVPAVLLSGVVLETYTRDHCGQESSDLEPNPNFKGYLSQNPHRPMANKNISPSIPALWN